jgi:hypothetical protein
MHRMCDADARHANEKPLVGNVCRHPVLQECCKVVVTLIAADHIGPSISLRSSQVGGVGQWVGTVGTPDGTARHGTLVSTKRSCRKAVLNSIDEKLILFAPTDSVRD